MDTLIIIGIGLGVVTGLCATVYEMAGARGRHRWGWTLAAFIGLCFALVGWVVVAVTLVLVGPTRSATPGSGSTLLRFHRHELSGRSG